MSNSFLFHYEKSFHLDDCIAKFTSEELLTGNEKVNCSVCKKPCTFVKRLSFFRLPKILIFHLKRFSKRTKLLNEIIFPLQNLDMLKYLDKDAPSMFKIFL